MAAWKTGAPASNDGRGGLAGETRVKQRPRHSVIGDAPAGDGRANSGAVKPVHILGRAERMSAARRPGIVAAERVRRIERRRTAGNERRQETKGRDRIGPEQAHPRRESTRIEIPRFAIVSTSDRIFGLTHCSPATLICEGVAYSGPIHSSRRSVSLTATPPLRLRLGIRQAREHHGWAVRETGD